MTASIQLTYLIPAGLERGTTSITIGDIAAAILTLARMDIGIALPAMKSTLNGTHQNMTTDLDKLRLCAEAVARVEVAAAFLEKSVRRLHSNVKKVTHFEISPQRAIVDAVVKVKEGK